METNSYCSNFIMAKADVGNSGVVDVFQRAVEMVIDKGQYEVLKFLLSNFYLDVDKHFLLHRALVAQQENIAKLFVESGADVNNCHEKGPGLRDYEEGCAHYSCYLPLQLSLFCSLDMTRFLLDFGADINKRNILQETVLIFACGTSVGADRVTFLLEHGAKVNARDGDKATGLHWAVQIGNTETVKLLIDYGADIEAKDIYGCTTLMWACRNSVGVACLKILLDKGADCHVPNITGETGLHLAAKSGNSIALKLLIQYGAQLEARTYDGDTALILACEESVPAECVRILLENRAFPNVQNRERTTPLHLAKEIGNEEKIQMLLKNGATEEDRVDQNVTNLMLACGKPGNVRLVLNLLQNHVSPNVKNKFGETALHKAVHTGDIKTLKVLVQYNADVNAMTNHDETPLMLASSNRRPNVKCVKFLLENKTLPNVTTLSGDTALHRTLRLGNTEPMKLLVKYGADVNVRDGHNQTPLMLACANSSVNVKCVKFLLENKALPNVTDSSGDTALHILMFSYLTNKIWRDISEIVKLLAKHGADLEARTSGGETPFLTAVRKRDRQLIELFHDLGADVCAEDVNGQNAIMLVIETGERKHETRDLGLLQYLISKGLPVNHRNKNDSTALMLAAEGRKFQSLKCLLDAGADVHAVRTEETEGGRRDITLFTPLSIMLDDIYWDRSGCAEELIRRGAVNSLPERYNGFLHQMIWAFMPEVINLLLTHGMAPTMSDSAELLRFGSASSVSPLTVALFMYWRNIPVIQYLVGNLMLCPCDIYGHSYFSQWRHRLISENKTDVVTMMDEFYSQPKSLFQLSFVTVSHALGGVPGRVDRINSLPLPSIVKDKLLFKSIDVRMDPI